LNKKITDKDLKDWKKFVNSKEKVHNKDQEKFRKVFKYSEKAIDLHGYSLEDANKEIEKFILYCFEKGILKLNIITGKGSRSKNKEDPYQSKNLSILKYSVPSFIKENKILMKKISKIDFDAVEESYKGSFEII